MVQLLFEDIPYLDFVESILVDGHICTILQCVESLFVKPNLSKSVFYFYHEIFMDGSLQ